MHNLGSSLKEKKEKQRQKFSTLWIYGDSISYYFHYRLQKTHLCKRVFGICENTYNWIYPKTLYEMVDSPSFMVTYIFSSKLKV